MMTAIRKLLLSVIHSFIRSMHWMDGTRRPLPHLLQRPSKLLPPPSRLPPPHSPRFSPKHGDSLSVPALRFLIPLRSKGRVALVLLDRRNNANHQPINQSGREGRVTVLAIQSQSRTSDGGEIEVRRVRVTTALVGVSGAENIIIRIKTNKIGRVCSCRNRPVT